MDDILEHHSNRIRSADYVIRWIVAVAAAVVFLSVYYYRVNAELSAHDVAIKEYGATIRGLERSDLVKTEKLNAILEALTKIDRKLDK